MSGYVPFGHHAGHGISTLARRVIGPTDSLAVDPVCLWRSRVYPWWCLVCCMSLTVYCCYFVLLACAGTTGPALLWRGDRSPSGRASYWFVAGLMLGLAWMALMVWLLALTAWVE